MKMCMQLKSKSITPMRVVQLKDAGKVKGKVMGKVMARTAFFFCSRAFFFKAADLECLSVRLKL